MTEGERGAQPQPQEPQPRGPSLVEALSTMVFLLAMLVVGVRHSVNTVPMMVLATVWVMLVGWRCGYTYAQMMAAVTKRLGDLMEVILILLSIGMFVASMMFSGSIPALIYYLVGIIDPTFIVVLSFLICAVVSVLVGTSWGTAGTVGVVMISIAMSMGANLPIVAGAVIGGTHVGQLLSPMSDTTNIGANLAGTDVTSMIRRISRYGVPVLALSTIAYLVLGLWNGAGTASLETSELIRSEIARVFSVNPVVALPLVLVFVMTFKKQPIVLTLVVSSLVALAFGAVFNGWALTAGLEALFSGFDLSAVTGLDPSAFSDVFLTLVNRGGITAQVNAALLAIVATCYGAVMIQIKAVDVIAEGLFSRVTSRVGLVVSSILTALMVVALTTSAYLGVLMSSDLFRHKFREQGMDDLDLLSSCMSVSTQAVVLVPWVDTAIFMVGITGVPTLASLPFNFFGWGNAVTAIVLAIVGFGFANGRRSGSSGESDAAA